MKKLGLCLLLIALTGCFGRQRATISNSIQKSSSPVKTIAISPSSGMFGDAIGIELANRGFTVIDSGQAASLLVTIGMDKLQVYRPDRAKPIVDKGVDAILIVKTSNGYDNRPDSATVKLVNLKDGQIIVGANWQNGKEGGRNGIVNASKTIADSITKALR